MPYKLSEKRREYMRAWWRRKYATNPEFRATQRANNAKTEARYGPLRDALVAEFKRNGCYLCSESEPACIAAHHLRDKLFAIGEGMRRKYSPERIRAELEKCLPLCANCHSKVHAGLISILPGMPLDMVTY